MYMHTHIYIHICLYTSLSPSLPSFTPDRRVCVCVCVCVRMCVCLDTWYKEHVPLPHFIMGPLTPERCVCV